MALLFSMILKKYHPPPPPPKKKRKEKRKHSKMGGSRGTCNRETMPIPGAHNLEGGGGVGSLVIFGWGCAAGTLAPLVYTRACSREFCYPSTRLNSPNAHLLPILE